MKNKRGFTLSEILVVVLIIGVLTAIAFPGYKKSVEKSRATGAINIMSTVAKSEHAWYLDHNNYTDKFANLAIELIDKNGAKARGDTLQTALYNYKLLDTGIFVSRTNGEYKLYRDYNSQQILCAPNTHYICKDLGAFTKEPCENADMAWANTNTTCYATEKDRCEGLYPNQTNLWNSTAEICGYKGVRTYKKTLDEGMQCITVNSYADCETLTINKGAKCISKTYEGCAHSTINGGICEGHGTNGCIDGIFNNGGECHAYKSGACRSSTFNGTSCCRGNLCPSGTPRCECDIDPNTGQHATSC